MKILQTEKLFSCPKFDVMLHVLRTDAGNELRREFLAHRGSVVMVPVLDDGRLVLETVFRHAIGLAVCELPAGTRDEGETFEQTAARELAEETGYTAGKHSLLMKYFPLPGITDEEMAVVLCEELSPGPPSLEPGEEIVVELVTLAEALLRIERGRITDGKTIVALWKYAAVKRLGG